MGRQQLETPLKLFRKTNGIGDKRKLRDDIDKLVRWSEKWQMLFNFGNCKCLHTGLGNTDMNFGMGGTIRSKTVHEKDLAVTIDPIHAAAMTDKKRGLACRFTAKLRVSTYIVT